MTDHAQHLALKLNGMRFMRVAMAIPTAPMRSAKSSESPTMTTMLDMRMLLDNRACSPSRMRLVSSSMRPSTCADLSSASLLSRKSRRSSATEVLVSRDFARERCVDVERGQEDRLELVERRQHFRTICDARA